MSYTFHTTGNMAFQWELETGNRKKQKKQANAWMEPNYYGQNECNELMEKLLLGALIHYNTHPLDCVLMQCSQQNLHAD